MNLKFRNLIIVSFFAISGFANAQPNITDQTVKKYAKEVFGTTETYQSKEHLQLYKEKLQRIEIKKLDQLSINNSDLKILSSVRLLNKYANISYDNKTNFKPNNFNALKYAFDFNNKKDQYFLVNGTNYIIILKAKK